MNLIELERSVRQLRLCKLDARPRPRVALHVPVEVSVRISSHIPN